MDKLLITGVLFLSVLMRIVQKSSFAYVNVGSGCTDRHSFPAHDSYPLKHNEELVECNFLLRIDKII